MAVQISLHLYTIHCKEEYMDLMLISGQMLPEAVPDKIAQILTIQSAPGELWYYYFFLFSFLHSQRVVLQYDGSDGSVNIHTAS